MAKGKKDCLRRQIIKELCWESGRIRITLSRSGLMEHNSEDSKLSVCIQSTGMSILEFYLKKKKGRVKHGNRTGDKKGALILLIHQTKICS